MEGSGRRFALAAILVVGANIAPDITSAALAAGIPAPGFAVSDFAADFPGGNLGPIGVAFDATGQLYVADYPQGAIYRFGPSGGSASTHLLATGLGSGAAGLTFTSDGRLYLARQSIGDVVELDPGTGTFKRTVASGFHNPTGLATDPLSGDLFVSLAGGGPTVYRLTNFQSGPATITAYASVDVDGITFAPNGTLYGSGGGTVYRIEGTNSPSAGQLTTIASVPNADGIALVAPAPGSSAISQLAVNRVDGIITLVDFSVTPATTKNIVTGGTRGDFVAVGPDRCLYATQSSTVEKVTASDGSCPFLPTGVAPKQLTFCPQQGQMVNNFSPLKWDSWSMQFGISACEGLVLSRVALGARLMAERMSLPYVDVVTCSSSTDVAHCSSVTSRHITLQPDKVEPQIDPTAYTRVHLATPSPGVNTVPVPPPTTSPCNGRFPCAHINVVSRYRVDLTQAPDVTFLDIIQRYEFYKDFSSKDSGMKDLSCEPSPFAPPPFSIAVTPLADCGRWKPIVDYYFHDATGTTLLRSVNAVVRLHFTPDALADRADTFIRDCDNNAPTYGCFLYIPGAGYLFEVYGPPGQPETAIRQEVAIRGLVAASDGTTQPGRYDNVHQTPKHDVVSPLPPPGCPECVHIHWRWGASIPGVPSFYGSGKPLIGDADPAAQPDPFQHQQLDVALVPYHSEQLAPNDYLLLVNGANQSNLNLSSSNNKYVGGVAKGTETLSYPPLTCADKSHLASWGQCGQVLYMSATTFTVRDHDEDSSSFFAFGGFFCETCVNPEYSDVVSALVPTYSADNHAIPKLTVVRGSQLRIQFRNLPGAIQLNDVLPKGLINVSGYFVTLVPTPPPGGPPPVPCALSTDADGHPVVTCNLPGTSAPSDVTITATVGSSVTPGGYQNTVHAIWGALPSISDAGGNYKKSDDITIA